MRRFDSAGICWEEDVVALLERLGCPLDTMRHAMGIFLLAPTPDSIFGPGAPRTPIIGVGLTPP